MSKVKTRNKNKVLIEGGHLTVDSLGDEIALVDGCIKKGSQTSLWMLAMRFKYGACRWATGDFVVDALTSDEVTPGSVDGEDDEVKVLVTRSRSSVFFVAMDMHEASMTVKVTVKSCDLGITFKGDATPAILYALGNALWEAALRGKPVAQQQFGLFGQAFAKALAMEQA